MQWWPILRLFSTRCLWQKNTEVFRAFSGWRRATAADNETKYETEVAETLENNFYVDDMLKSVSIEEVAIKLMQGVRKICADWGFHRTEFVSSNKHLLVSIPEDEHRKEVLDRDLKFRMLRTEKALGIYWNTGK